ncbi:MAG: hypothetical protein R3A79_18030 [Nannocystaceae bacterium]
MSERTRAALLFFVGVAAFVTFAAIYAAYDLWGGVPRGLWRFLSMSLVLGVLGVGFGGARWIQSWPAEERPRRALRAAIVLGAIAASVGGALYLYYDVRRETSRAICSPGHFAPTLQERQEILAEGLGPLFPVIDPDSECTALKRDVDALVEEGACPLFPPRDAACRCGRDVLRAGESRCANGPTTCERRDDDPTESFGCAGARGRGALDDYAEYLRWH